MEHRLKRHRIWKEGMDKWLSTYAKLVALEFVLSVVFFTLGHIIDNAYVRGVGIGLLIAWVTGVIAYFVVRKRA
jgi:VIT1/CCC1 family predicted Fe2+/Mn2+ transporter